MSYLITGASGQIGSKVVARLVELGERPRIFVRDVNRARSLFRSHADVFEGDLAKPESLKPAVEGVDALFLINIGPEIARRDQAAAELARAAGVKLVVKLSALSAAQELAIGAWHAQGEAAIRASGVAFTFVRPAGFMSNVLGWAPSIKAESVVRACTGEGRVAYIHPDDVAAVSAKALLTRQYVGQSLHITGPRGISYAEMTRQIGAIIGKQLRFEPISDDEARRRLLAGGMESTETEALIGLWRGIRQGQLATATNQVEDVLGQKPRSFQQWVQQNAATFQGGH